jgi:hypothetical protein
VRWGSNRASNQARWGFEALLGAPLSPRSFLLGVFLSWELSPRSFSLLGAFLSWKLSSPRSFPLLRAFLSWELFSSRNFPLLEASLS